MPRPRPRALAALALLVLAVALLGSSALLARAASDAPRGSFAVPARAPGDQGSYEVAAHGQAPGADLEQGRLFETPDWTAVHAADGSTYGSLPVRETWLLGDGDDAHEEWRVAYDDGLEPASAEAFVDRDRFSGLRCEGGALVPCTTVSVGENALYQVSTDHSRRVFGQDGGLCGLRNGAQGQRVGLDEPVRFLGDCATPWLRAIRATSLPGHADVVVFSGKSGGRLTQVWLAADVPYPVRVWDGRADGSATASSLSAFAQVVPDPVAGPPAVPLPMPGDQPRGRLGPSTAGFAMDWPLEAAVDAAARQEPLANYLAAHPEAQLAAAEFRESTNGHWREREWLLAFAGDAPKGFAIHLNEPEPGEPAVTAPFYSSDPSAPADGDFFVEAYDVAPPPLSALPARLPAVADVARIYERIRPSPEAQWDANAWAFAVTCPDPCRGPQDAQAWVAAGHSRLLNDKVGATQRVGVPQARPDLSSHVLLVAAGADALRFVERVDQARGGYEAGGGWDASNDPDWVAASQASGSTWSGPGPLVAAGTGLALLLAAAVLFADALRHGGLGLFSRIAPARLADHPVRARLLEAIAAEPGLHFSGLARRLDLAPGAAQHHLRRLAGAGLVVAAAGGRTRYFPAGTPPAVQGRAQLLDNPGINKVLAAVQARPGISVSAVAAATGRAVGTVAHHLDRLQQAGLVERRRSGRTVHVYPRP